MPVFGQNTDSSSESDEKTDSIREVKVESVSKEKVKQDKSKTSKKKAEKAVYRSYELEDSSSEPSINSQQTYKAVESNFNVNEVQSNTQRTQRTPSINQQVEMDNAVEYFKNTSPESFEYNYYNYAAGNHDVSREQNLVIAENIRPSNSDVHVQKAALHIIKDEKAQALGYLEKLIASKRLSQSAIVYGKDLLNSVDQNGTLITHGFDDNYSAWYAQNKLGIRTDVTLVSLDFLQSNFYKNQLKNKGYLIPQSKVVNVDYFTAFCKMNKGKKLSASLTLPKEYFKNVLPNLFVTGLVFEYHENSFNNFSRNDRLWRSGLNKELINQASDEKAKQLSSNYLPMLFQLRKVYNQKGDDKTVQLLDKEIDLIGVQCKKFDKVQKLKGAY